VTAALAIPLDGATWLAARPRWAAHHGAQESLPTTAPDQPADHRRPEPNSTTCLAANPSSAPMLTLDCQRES